MALGKRNAFHTPHRKRRIFWKRIMVGSTSVIMLASVCALVFYGTRVSMFTVDDVVVRGLQTVPESEVRSRADALLAGAYYGLIPHRFAPTVPTERIAASVESLSRVADATVERSGRTLVVSVHEHAPDMLWCADQSTISLCWYVDAAGGAYERAPALTGSSLMRFVVEGVVPEIGAALLEDETRALLLGVARILDERHEFRVGRIVYHTNGDATLELAGGGYLIVSTEHDLEDTYANLSSVLSTEAYANLAPGRFEYIDLRFGNKVFVQKEKPIATTTASTTPEVE